MGRSPSDRKMKDVLKLLKSDREVIVSDDGSFDRFHVILQGPKDTPYEGGWWKLSVRLPATYPYKSPSIGFVNKILHPNIDEASGTVCLNVINQTWSPMYQLANVFD